MTCLECKEYQFLLNGVLYCSTTEGCLLLDKTTGNCLRCDYSYFAGFNPKTDTDIEISCSK